MPRNEARTEVSEECCENGGLDLFDDERSDTFMIWFTVPFDSPLETDMKTNPVTGHLFDGVGAVMRAEFLFELLDFIAQFHALVAKW